MAKATTVSETPSISPEQPISAPGSDSAPKERAPMLDVHPPHHAASTWRDFFILNGETAADMKMMTINQERFEDPPTP